MLDTTSQQKSEVRNKLSSAQSLQRSLSLAFDLLSEVGRFVELQGEEPEDFELVPKRDPARGAGQQAKPGSRETTKLRRLRGMIPHSGREQRLASSKASCIGRCL